MDWNNNYWGRYYAIHYSSYSADTAFNADKNAGQIILNSNNIISEERAHVVWNGNWWYTGNAQVSRTYAFDTMMVLYSDHSKHAYCCPKCWAPLGTPEAHSYKYIPIDETGHKVECSYCNYKTAKEDHQWMYLYDTYGCELCGWYYDVFSRSVKNWRTSEIVIKEVVL